MNKILDRITKKIQSKWNDYNENASKQSLLDIMMAFHIPVDDKRLEDYEIELDLSPLKLRVVDNKEKTFYESTIKNGEENMKDGYIIETTTQTTLPNECLSALKQIKRTYFSSNPESKSDIPFKEELILSYGDLQISYKTESSGITLDENNKTSITYSGLDSCGIHPILEYTILKNILTPYYTSSLISYRNNSPYITIDTTEEISSDSNNLIYTVKSAGDNDLNTRGVCFFKSNVSYSEKKKAVPFGFDLDFFPELFAPEVISSIMFDGISPDSFYNTLTITKKQDKISADYLKTLEQEKKADEELDEKSLYNECYSVEIPSISTGPITEEELAILREKMLLEWPNNFISFVDSKLEHFQNLIAEYKGKKAKDDPFMLEYLFLQPISIVDELIEENKDSYFAVLNNGHPLTETTANNKSFTKRKARTVHSKK